MEKRKKEKKMRKFFLIGLLFIFLSCSPKISTNPIEKDCEYLRTVLTEASIDFNQAVDAGLDIDDFINDVKNRYANFAERDCKTKYEKPDENGIYNTAFAVAITHALQNSLKRENTHMTIKGKNVYIAKSYVNRVYLSDIFFEKIDDAFYVQNKFNSDIAKGMKYTGNVENIVKEYNNGDYVYRYIIFSEKISLNTAEINLDNKIIEIPVRRDELNPRNGKDLWYEEKGNKLYIIARTFKPHLENNIENYEKTRDEICEKINNFSTVIFDFRDNNGGYAANFIPILATMLFSNIDFYNDERCRKLEADLEVGEIVLTTETIKNSYLLDGQMPSINYFEDKKERYKTFTQEGERIEIDNPAFNGKIFIIMNTFTTSAAEKSIAFLKYYFKDKVFLIGEKSAGMLDFGGSFSYLLPDSKIRIQLCHIDNTGNKILSKENGWRGDTEGFYPDYWIFSENEDHIDDFIKLHSK